MKVYVDELPKSCSKCDRFCLDEKGRFRCILNSMPDYRSQEEKENSRRNDCPLHSLADHDKQVRKEVCDENRNRHNYILHDDGYEFNEETGDWETVLKTFDYNLTEEDLKELEQGETK